MTLFSFLLLLVVAAIAGAIGHALVGSSPRGGCLINIVVGFLGAWLGIWMAGALGLPTFFVVDAGGMDFPVVWAIIGSGVLVAVLSLLFGEGRW